MGGGAVPVVDRTLAGGSQRQAIVALANTPVGVGEAIRIRRQRGERVGERAGPVLSRQGSCSPGRISAQRLQTLSSPSWPSRRRASWRSTARESRSEAPGGAGRGALAADRPATPALRSVLAGSKGGGDSLHDQTRAGAMSTRAGSGIARDTLRALNERAAALCGRTARDVEGGAGRGGGSHGRRGTIVPDRRARGAGALDRVARPGAGARARGLPAQRDHLHRASPSPTRFGAVWPCLDSGRSRCGRSRHRRRAAARWQADQEGTHGIDRRPR